MPPGALGLAPDRRHAIVDPETKVECPPAFSTTAECSFNAEAAIGEIVSRAASPFEGYYEDPEASAYRIREAGTGPGTSPIGTPRATSTLPAAAAIGCGSIRRT